MKKAWNGLLMFIYTVLLGAVTGSVIWGFLKLMNLCIGLLWDTLPAKLDFWFYTPVVCIVGSLLTGLYKKKFGDYPEELPVVLAKVKEDGGYQYHNIPMMLGAAFLPLIFGASVGPEAGLTGVIAGFCTWIGDKLKRAHAEMEELTRIGVSATLGTIFRSPMFGFVEPLENEKGAALPKTSKTVLYFTAGLSSFGIFFLLNRLTGTSTGFASIEPVHTELIDYLWIIPLTLIGVIAGWLYFAFRKLSVLIFTPLEKYPVAKALIGGVALGFIGLLLPLCMFSGEHQIETVVETGAAIGAVMLLVIGAVKLLLTNICITSGLKGGHFFPVIFSGIAVGYAVSLMIGVDPALCMGAVTAALVAHTMKKPFAAALLLLLLFPVRMIPVTLAAAVLSCVIKTPGFLLTLPENTEENK